MDAPPVHYVTTSDGYDIAYCISGEGVPLVFLPPAMSNVQLAWRFYPDWLEGLASRFRFIQYDSRGEGMSTRGLPGDVSMADFGRDLETVADRLRLERFVVWGWGRRAHIAIHYAATHPDRVRALILNTCSASNSAWNTDVLEAADENWEFLLRSLVVMNASDQTLAEHQRMHDDFRNCITQDDFMLMNRALFASSVEGELSRLIMPVLVLHQREHFMLQPEEGMKLAAKLPDARFVLLDTHDMFGDAQQGLAAVDSFVAESLPPVNERGPAAGALPHGLSTREVEVLRLLAEGKSNQEIADELVISRNTVRRHVSNVFDKTGVANRAQAVAYARDHGLA
jgi:DNA-binding CsgD family transcriptional regulator/pimeloyl-ACP methyl ester carboxylesterase